MKATSEQAAWMREALTEGYKGFGTTSPNPPVGAVLVREGRIIGRGYHHEAGKPHAERMALADARERGESPLGADLYVTLEPCSTVGRTPACTDAIIEAGIRRVFYACVDPNARHRGRADALLRAAGIEVHAGLEAAACGVLLRPWAYAMEHGRPWVVAKLATTLDGSMTRRGSAWLSNEESLRYAHDLRLRSDAILVGGHTVRTDNPRLTIRNPHLPIPPEKKQPLRVVLTGQGIPADCCLLTDEYRERTLVFSGAVRLGELLERLYREHGVVQLMLECGPRLLRRFLEQGMVQEWVQNITPYVSGGCDTVAGGDFLPRELRLVDKQVVDCGSDIILQGLLQ